MQGIAESNSLESICCWHLISTSVSAPPSGKPEEQSFLEGYRKRRNTNHWSTAFQRLLPKHPRGNKSAHFTREGICCLCHSLLNPTRFLSCIS